MRPWAERSSQSTLWFIYLFFLSVTRHRPPLGKIVFRTLNYATCDVYFPKAVERLTQGNVTDIGSFNVCKIYFFWLMLRTIGNTPFKWETGVGIRVVLAPRAACHVQSQYSGLVSASGI